MYTMEDYQKDHINNDYVEHKLRFRAWTRKMREYDHLTARLNKVLARSDHWDEEEYWELEKECSDLCKVLGF